MTTNSTPNTDAIYAFKTPHEAPSHAIPISQLQSTHTHLNFRSLRLLHLTAFNLHNLPRTRRRTSQHSRSPYGARTRYAHAHNPPLKLVPTVRRLQNVLFHGDAEAVAVVFGRGDCWLVFAAVFDPGFQLFVPGVCAYAVCMAC